MRRSSCSACCLALIATLAGHGRAAAPDSRDHLHQADLAQRALRGNVPSPLCLAFGDGFEATGPTPRPPVTVTTSGGYRITVDRHTVTIRDPLDRNKVEHWGDPHENLNGKHIKDWGGAAGWDGARRSIELGDGSKVTLEAYGPQGVIFATSLYDGTRNVQIDNCRNAIGHASDDALDTEEREQLQYDGEIARFSTDPSTASATYENLGNEDAGFQFTASPQPLGTTGGTSNPNQVVDFFDDPRLGHT